MSTMQAKAGADAETLATTTSRRPPQAELPKRCLQEGSDAKSAVVVRPNRSRLSPGKLNEGEGRGGKDDAFKKMNGARRRRRHRSTRRPMAFASTSKPLQSRGPNNAGTTQESPPAATRSSRQEGTSERWPVLGRDNGPVPPGCQRPAPPPLPQWPQPSHGASAGPG